MRTLADQLERHNVPRSSASGMYAMYKKFVLKEISPFVGSELRTVAEFRKET